MSGHWPLETYIICTQIALQACRAPADRMAQALHDPACTHLPSSSKSLSSRAYGLSLKCPLALLSASGAIEGYILRT